MKSALHIAALQWAEAGFYCFPIIPGRKEPGVKSDWESAATTDTAAIDAWWTENPNYNIGCAPDRSGCVVLDADGDIGVATLRGLLAGSGAPATLQIATPRPPGVHLWFAGAGTNTVGTEKNGHPKLDTRGAGGYVLLPPSIIAPGEYANNPTGGSYSVQSNNEIQELPVTFQALFADKTSELAGAGDLDNPANIRRLELTLDRLVAAGEVAVEGSGGDDRTYKLCCEALDLGVSIEKAGQLILERWNPHCIPPWEADEIFAKLEHANDYRQNGVGAYALTSPQEEFAGAEKFAVTSGTPASNDGKKSRFYPLDLTEQANQKAPEWIIPDFIPANGLVVAFGKPKSFKSFLVLDLCLGVASGEATFGHTPAQKCVVYCAGEGANAIGKLHVPAWRIARSHVQDFPFYVVPRVPRVIIEDEVHDLIAQIKARNLQPGVVVIDTMARSAGGLEENSAKDIGVFVAACDLIRETFGCTVIVVHHAGKDISRGSRGSNALEGAFDTMIEIVRHEKTNTVAAYVREQRNAQERETPYTFQGHVIGGTLVFDPCNMEEYMAVVEADKLITTKRIGAVLKSLNAYGYTKGVTGEVLVTELARGTEVDTKSLLRELSRARKKQTAIAMLCDGDPLLWHLVG